MPTDLTREEIEQLRDELHGALTIGAHLVRPLVEHAFAEPARLAAAKAEGVREGIEDAKRAAGFAAWRHEGDDAYSRGMDAGARHQVTECVKAIAALSSPPAEPTAAQETTDAP
jgi:hypothetical protein